MTSIFHKDTFTGKSRQLVLDILWDERIGYGRPSRSNDAKHPMSGTRLMNNILYANIIRDENLLLEVVYMLDDDIKYQRLTLRVIL